jgi:hypothetical protein
VVSSFASSAAAGQGEKKEKKSGKKFSLSGDWRAKAQGLAGQ